MGYALLPRHAALYLAASTVGYQDPRQDLDRGGFPGAVGPDVGHELTTLDLEAHIAQGVDCPMAATKETTGSAKPMLAQNAEEAIAKFDCAACHSILSTESPVGPSLQDIGKRLTIDQIRESIIAPNAVIVEGYPPIMPDFSERMMINELEMIVQFLAQQGGDPS